MGIRTVRVLGRTFKVSWQKDDLAGYCDREAGTINVDPDTDEHSKKVFLLHESMHAVLFQQGLILKYKAEEAIVRPLAFGLLAVLRDNPAMTKWLLSKDKDVIL